MTRRTRRSAHGPGSATGAGAPDLRAWWARTPSRTGPARPAQEPAPDPEEAHLRALATAAAAVQQASDEHEVFEAVADAVALRGLSGHLATLDPSGDFLSIRRTVLPWAHQAELERLHGGPMVGTRIDVAGGGAHWTAVHQRCAMHAPEALAWVLGAAPGTGPAEADAIGAYVGLGEALLVPITDERDVFGVLTVWSPTLTSSDRAVAEILGRLAGGALSSQRARGAAWRDPRTLAA